MTLEAFGPAFMLAAWAGTVASSAGLRRMAVTGAAAVIFGGSLFPFNGVSVSGFALAFSGALSAATLMLAAQLLLRALGRDVRSSGTFLACAFVSGLLLYPTASGF